MDKSASGAFEQLIERAVETGVRKALNVNDVTNRRLFSIDEGALYLSLSKRAIHYMIAAAELPAVKHGRRKMLDIKDLDAWITQNKKRGS